MINVSVNNGKATPDAYLDRFIWISLCTTVLKELYHYRKTTEIVYSLVNLYLKTS